MIIQRFVKLILVLILLNANPVLAGNIDGVVVQGNGDKAQFERSLKLASNMHEILKTTRFEVVIFGPTVKFLTALSDEVPLIQKVQAEGIKIIACGRSLKTDDVKEADLAPDIAVVPFGAVYIVEKQHAGWQYFKP